MTTQKVILRAAEIGALILLFVYYVKFQDLKSESLTTLSILNEKEAQIETIKLSNGRLKHEKSVAVLEAGQLSKVNEYYKKELEDLKENHGVKIQHLHSYYRAKLSTQSSGEVAIGDTVIITKDSIEQRYPKIHIDDNYLTLSGFFTDARFKYEYMITDSLSVAYHWTQKGVWPFRSNDELKISFSSSNPNTKLQDVTSFMIQDKKKTRLSIGPFVGYGVGNSGLSVQLGIGISYSLIRL